MITATNTHGRIDGLFYLLVGGPIALTWGLRKLKEKRLLQNTPLSKVRSAAMGLVGLQGMARQRAPTQSPLSNRNACWWSCRVEELRSSGRSSSWHTIKQVDSNMLFYLEDPSGRVLINPLGAELHVSSNTFNLNASTRTQIAPVLNNWGINDMAWFGGEKTMRIIEQLIPDGAPLYVLGDLVTIGNDPDDRRAVFMARLRAIKADPKRMAEADTNHDGSVDAEEWTAFEAKLEAAFAQEQNLQAAQNPTADHTMVIAPVQSTFVVSTEEENSLVSSFMWLAPLGIFGGIALSGLGVWWALALEWHPLFILGMIGLGFLLSVFSKSLNSGFGRS